MSFHDAQAGDPFDPAPMLIQADWLEEHGDQVGAEVLRGLAASGTPSLHALALEAALSPVPWKLGTLKIGPTSGPISGHGMGSEDGSGSEAGSRLGSGLGFGSGDGFGAADGAGTGHGDAHVFGEGNGGEHIADRFDPFS